MKKKVEFGVSSGARSGLGSAIGSGSISQRYGFGDPDPLQNVTDPEHWYRLNTVKFHA
jgi:hypothetical protein